MHKSNDNEQHDYHDDQNHTGHDNHYDSDYAYDDSRITQTDDKHDNNDDTHDDSDSDPHHDSYDNDDNGTNSEDHQAGNESDNDSDDADDDDDDDDGDDFRCAKDGGRDAKLLAAFEERNESDRSLYPGRDELAITNVRFLLVTSHGFNLFQKRHLEPTGHLDCPQDLEPYLNLLSQPNSASTASFRITTPVLRADDHHMVPVVHLEKDSDGWAPSQDVLSGSDRSPKTRDQ